jgi:JmjC domain, hydroxylase
MDSEDSTFCAEYGDNLEGSAFREGDSRAWNLQTLPCAPGSVLKHIQTDIPGVSSPMLYHGMAGAMFCWHIEDLYLHSINYHHAGAPKVWYGVAAPHATAFEKAMKDYVRTVVMCTVLLLATHVSRSFCIRIKCSELH